MKAAIVRYNPILVIDRFMFANNGVSILNKFLISNWSSGLSIVMYFMLLYDVYYKYKFYKLFRKKSVTIKKRFFLICTRHKVNPYNL